LITYRELRIHRLMLFPHPPDALMSHLSILPGCGSVDFASKPARPNRNPHQFLTNHLSRSC
jgi:hypothetical protein